MQKLTYPFDISIWEGAEIVNYKDGSVSLGHSIVAKGKLQIAGPMCALIAIYNSDPKFLNNTIGILSPWGLFEHLTSVGWNFETDKLLEGKDIAAIADIIGCSFKVHIGNVFQIEGKESPELNLYLNEYLHYKNGSELKN